MFVVVDNSGSNTDTSARVVVVDLRRLARLTAQLTGLDVFAATDSVLNFPANFTYAVNDLDDFDYEQWLNYCRFLSSLKPLLLHEEGKKIRAHLPPEIDPGTPHRAEPEAVSRG